MASPHELAHGDRMKSHATTADEKEILALIERWSKSVRDEDRAAIRTDTMRTY
jgi:hypothetical protein